MLFNVRVDARLHVVEEDPQIRLNGELKGGIKFYLQILFYLNNTETRKTPIKFPVAKLTYVKFRLTANNWRPLYLFPNLVWKDKVLLDKACTPQPRSNNSLLAQHIWLIQ